MDTEKAVDPIAVAHGFTQILDQLGVPYFIGGSIASSFLGEYRFTNDIDFVTEMSFAQIDPMLRSLGEDYYISKDAVIEAVAKSASFNLIHIPTITKIDVFVSRKAALDREQMARRRSIEIRPGLQLFIASPEDVILSKLLWFKKGGSVSDRQWRDIQGVMKVQGTSLNRDYLEQWARSIGVLDLLEKAFSA